MSGTNDELAFVCEKYSSSVKFIGRAEKVTYERDKNIVTLEGHGLVELSDGSIVRGTKIIIDFSSGMIAADR